MALPREPLLNQLRQRERRYVELEQRVAQLASASNTPEYQQLSKELAQLKELVMLVRTYQRIEREVLETEQLIHAQGDADLRELARDEAVSLRQQQTALWEERDRAIKDGETTLNNLVVPKYAADKDARWGAKSKNNIWFGYKRHTAVDMRHGLIEKTAVTPANVLDFKALKHICPNQGLVFMDKLYDCKEADLVLQIHGCHSATIRKNNNKTKQKDLDRWRSSVRMPFEGVFSKLKKRARYRGLSKVVFQNFFASIVHNLKKAVAILPREAAPA